MSEHWQAETDADGILWLCLDQAGSKGNVLSSDVLSELNDIVEPLVDAPPAGLVLWSGKEQSFVMGADINEFETIDSEKQAFDLVRLGQTLMDRIEALDCPTVAVINGVCMGGGLELAMACDYRLCFQSDKRQIGLPEVKLGLHPGFGGTVRVIRICGVRAGMPIQLTGSSINAQKANAIGLVDQLTDAKRWRDDALKLIRSRPAKQRAPIVDRILTVAPLRPIVTRMLLGQVRGKARREHYPAPYAMIDLWATEGASESSGYEAEARSFAKLVMSATSRNLVRVFFLQSKLKNQGARTGEKVGHVHVVGAGVMGGDIAAWCALRGLTVTLQDREQKYVDPALQRAATLFEKRVRDENERTATIARLQGDVPGDGARQADLIIEAIFENLEAKQALYRELQEKMKPGALLATNTSSIRLEDLRTVLDEPQRFIGLHFFNPVAQLPLVEVIRCEDTDQEAINAGLAFTKDIGKLPLACNSAPGFVVNRVLAPYMGEAMAMAREGVSLATIDDAALRFGMPMGPIELVDTVGLDIAQHVAGILTQGSEREVPETDLEQLIEQGRLGRKAGHGYYRWEGGKAVKPPAADDAAPEDLTDRLILPLVNEAVACLSEGVVEEADLLDAGVIFGTGFAPFHGGPINYARERGTTAVVMRLNELARKFGSRFEPHAGWASL